MIRYGTSIAGAAGFAFVFGLGMALNRDLGRATISASIAALAFGLLAHWWMTLWLVSLSSSRKEQVQQQIEQRQEAAQEDTTQTNVEPTTETPVS
jgi:Na+/melibiose symporter-like transporter